MNDQLIALVNKYKIEEVVYVSALFFFFFRIMNIDNENAERNTTEQISLNSFEYDDSLLTQIYNELSRTAL